jgi:hypothetical protein
MFYEKVRHNISNVTVEDFTTKKCKKEGSYRQVMCKYSKVNDNKYVNSTS